MKSDEENLFLALARLKLEQPLCTSKLRNQLPVSDNNEVSAFLRSRKCIFRSATSRGEFLRGVSFRVKRGNSRADTRTRDIRAAEYLF